MITIISLVLLCWVGVGLAFAVVMGKGVRHADAVECATAPGAVASATVLAFDAPQRFRDVSAHAA